MTASAASALTFLGATRTVTGSRFLLETRPVRMLVDCGLYQGTGELRRRNWAPLGFASDRLDGVVLSHAHLDHSGWLPRLVRDGYAGPILCSPWTARVAPIVLRDAAHLQEEDADHAARRGYSKHRPPQPLFTTADAEKAIGLLTPVPYGRPYEIATEVTLTLRRAGHILGSSTVELRAGSASLGFTGDLGRTDHPLLAPPESAPAVDTMLVESTYGDRIHPPRDLAPFGDPVRAALTRGGVVLIPAFAIDRTPVLLLALRQLMHDGTVPDVPVYVDSPMALAALDVYRDAVRSGAEEIRADLREQPGDPFDTGQLRLAHSVEESMRLNDPGEPCIIISASGMATGGRVVHHLEHLLTDARNLILLPGFQVAGTRGRDLLDGATSLKMYGHYVPVRAEVVGVDEFSAHADARDMVEWLRTAPAAPKTCYVVHGEPDASLALARDIERDLGWCAVVPRPGERVLL
jgi:metallo-beta-lactamase family protein